MTEERRIADGLAEYLADRRTLLPKVFSSEEAAEQIISLFQKSDYSGATFNFYFGDLSGQPFFAVSPYPDLSETLPGVAVDQRDLKAFIMKHRPLLEDPRNSLGLWYDELNQETWIDISTVLPGKREAEDIGKRYNQIDSIRMSIPRSLLRTLVCLIALAV